MEKICGAKQSSSPTANLLSCDEKRCSGFAIKPVFGGTIHFIFSIVTVDDKIADCFFGDRNLKMWISVITDLPVMISLAL